jgi:hypothetical protein
MTTYHCMKSPLLENKRLKDTKSEAHLAERKTPIHIEEAPNAVDTILVAWVVGEEQFYFVNDRYPIPNNLPRVFPVEDKPRIATVSHPQLQ